MLYICYVSFSLHHCMHTVDAIWPDKSLTSSAVTHTMWYLHHELYWTACNTAERTKLISVAFIPVLFLFYLFSIILWFWSWVCLTFSSPRVRGFLHSVSLYPQPPAGCLNQKQRQPRRREREKDSVEVSVQRLENRGYGGLMIKVYAFAVSKATITFNFKCRWRALHSVTECKDDSRGMKSCVGQLSIS